MPQAGAEGSLMDPKYIHTIVSLALAEDVGSGDVTTNALVPAKHKSSACIIAKSAGIVCGLEFAAQAFRQLDPQVRFKALVKDGSKVKASTVVARITGQTRTLLTGERVALNFLSHLSGVATQTRAFADAVKPFKTAVMDTRKTTVLLRQMERYAVRCGGGVNHRFNLEDMVMIKDNHRAFAPGQLNLKDLVETFKPKKPVKVELEVDTISQLKEALNSGADVILLDNMIPVQVRQAVRLRNQAKSKALLEASGGITLRNVRAYAAAGVERISVGSLTHSHQALDMSLEFNR